jgi:hypothetical protein
MRSTCKGSVPRYLGVDLTDRYATNCRAIDVCGLTPADNGELNASFWFWLWDAAPETLNVGAVVKELTLTRAVMIDGPQGLAAHGSTIRACERQSAAAGKTPDVRPLLDRPFAGFLCSSLDLFATLKRAGVLISPSGFVGGVSEVYPGHIWKILANRPIPKKSSDEGRLARKGILAVLGVSRLPELPTHDQNDACVAAVLAAAADGAVPGLTLKAIGSPLKVDADGTLREGFMVIPEASVTIRESISRTLLGTPAPDLFPSRAPTPLLHPTDPDSLAEGLLGCFIDAALKGNPQICTYSWAYRYLFHASYSRWSQAYANRVVEVARRTCLRELPGLGAVRLDAFVVAKESGLPSDGHWQSAYYDREDWERALGTATVLH